VTTSSVAVARRGVTERDAVAPLAAERPRLHPWLVFTTAVVVAFFGLIYSRISLDRTGFDLDELEERIAFEEARHLDLEAELARLQDPARIDRLAQDMGLVYPDALVSLDVPAAGTDPTDADLRWAQVGPLLGAQP
jgi:cell division protein FtsL